MGSKGYSAGAHVVFKLVVHLVFVTKYRRKAITQRVFDVILHRARPNASHLDHDEQNNHPDNLAALCQKCHLAHDRDDNQRRAQASRSAKRERIDRMRGQTALPLDPAPATKRQTPSQKASP